MFTVCSTLIWAILTGHSRLDLSHWDPYTVHRGSCLELYYCNMVERFWWDSNLILMTNWFPSVFWHCWFAYLAVIVPEMTYNVLSGTLSLYTTAWWHSPQCYSCCLYFVECCFRKLFLVSTRRQSHCTCPLIIASQFFGWIYCVSGRTMLLVMWALPSVHLPVLCLHWRSVVHTAFVQLSTVIALLL